MQLHTLSLAGDLGYRIDGSTWAAHADVAIESVSDLVLIAEDVTPHFLRLLHPFANACDELAMHDSHVDQSPRYVRVFAVLDFVRRIRRLAEVDAMICERCVYVLRVEGHRTVLCS